MNVYICGGPRGVYRRRVQHCPECDCRHRFVERWDGAWYGVTLYGACGDYWQEGWRGERPFARGWRAKAQRQFRRMWDTAVSPTLYERFMHADLALYSPHIKSKRQETKALRRVAIAAELIRRAHLAASNP